MNKPIKKGQPLSLLTAAVTAMAVCWVAGCAKKSGREDVPETRDTLTVISDTLSKTRDTSLITHDTLSEIPNALTDKRDGKTYKTATIGKQTWMAENLNYRTPSGSWCYDDSNYYCDKYGRLYDWNTAKTACPAGWHLPSRMEWNMLIITAGGSDNAGKELKAKSGWSDYHGIIIDNTDVYKFSALPGGRRYAGGGFSQATYDGEWWSATGYDSGNAFYRNMYYYGPDIFDSDNDKFLGLSVRCIRDGGGELSAEEERAKKAEERKKEEALRKKETNPNIEKLSTYFTDPRDGRKYRAVEIGRVTWMAHNLNYETPSGSWCYDNDISNCTKYGRLYDWNTATKVCPTGWHLPTREEWNSLMLAVGGKRRADEDGGDVKWVGALDKLKAKRGWYEDELMDGNGTDDYGFSALPGGSRDLKGRNDGSISYYGSWWTATEERKWAYHIFMQYDHGPVDESYIPPDHASSVRCVKDGGRLLNSGELKKKEDIRQKEAEQWGTDAKQWNMGIEQRKKEEKERLDKLSAYFIDSRDGREYRAVKIGGKTWMAENLNYTPIKYWGYGNDNPYRSWCYNDSNSYCDIYGRLYDWNTAMRVCPAGWHLPSGKEWDSLVATVGGKVEHIIGSTGINRVWGGTGKKLKARTGWKWNDDEDKSCDGTDDYGFSALPGSLRHFNSEIGTAGFWWTSDSGYRRSIRCFDFFFEGDCANNLGHSVRCVRDAD